MILSRRVKEMKEMETTGRLTSPEKPDKQSIPRKKQPRIKII
tara:strand:+ start:186 stop:311 length:126 start_codon:yes stop_codon:yes gene_type:complete